MRYQVRQQVRTVVRSWLEVISDTTIERVARADYARLVAEHPTEYFELVEVRASENCLAFTALPQS